METRYCARLMIVDEAGRLLLFQYKDEHRPEAFWATAGGELKPGETYSEAAQRELYEETGLTDDIGPLLKEHDAVFAVARSVPALWKEQYFLVQVRSESNVFAADWTDEEKSTIQTWKWWTLGEMQAASSDMCKPDWLPELLAEILQR